MDDAAKKTAPTASPGWDVVDLLGEIADIGRDSVLGGYSRHLFEPAELALREWFTRRAEALGLDVELDSNGNIWAHWGAPGEPQAQGELGRLEDVA